MHCRCRLRDLCNEVARVSRRASPDGACGGSAEDGGEQFARPEAIEALRAARRNGNTDDMIAVASYDPLYFNVGDAAPKLCGLALTPLFKHARLRSGIDCRCTTVSNEEADPGHQ